MHCENVRAMYNIAQNALQLRRKYCVAFRNSYIYPEQIMRFRSLKLISLGAYS